MPALVEALPWNSLVLSEGEIQWDDLRALARAAVEDPDVRRRLMEASGTWEPEEGLEEDHGLASASRRLGAMAVFALAVEWLDCGAADEVAAFLIDLLERAGEAEDDWTMEWCEYVAGRLGPAIIEPALRLPGLPGSHVGCWPTHVSLLKTAIDADAETQERVVERCRRIVEESDDWSSLAPDAGPALDVLTHLNDTDFLPTLKRIYASTGNGELRYAIKWLETEPENRPPDRVCWATPIEEWLPREVEHLRKVYTQIVDEEEFDWPELDDSLPVGHIIDSPFGPALYPDFSRAIHREVSRVGRNDPCPCGSGKKYKKCCL